MRSMADPALAASRAHAEAAPRTDSEAAPRADPEAAAHAEAEAAPRPDPEAELRAGALPAWLQQPVHLLDATMFWNPSGGVRRYIGAKRRWTRQHTNWRHTVATPLPDLPASLRVPSLALPGSAGAYRLPWRRAATARVLQKAAPDLIESADPYRLAWATLDAAQALQIPSVAFCHSNLEQLARLSAGRPLRDVAARAARRYALHLYGEFDLVLAPSAAMVANLRDWGVGRAQHQPLGVDCDVFHPLRESVECRRALGLPRYARLLVYAGRFAAEKNLALLEAVVRRLGPLYWLVAVGDGPARPRGMRVVVLPTLREPTELARLIASCDVFVHAGAQETFGLSVLEALACGVPVVARAAQGLAELVDSEVGEGVGSDHLEEFAAAVAGVFDRDRDRLRHAARTRALAYDWERVLPQLWQHYRHLLERP